MLLRSFKFTPFGKMVYIQNESTRDLLNWKIFTLFTTGHFIDCGRLIEEQLYCSRGQCEYAIFVKGLIARNEGKISESLQLFQAATALNPNSVSNLKQVARSLYLLGRYKAAIAIYEKAQSLEDDDWESWHNCGLCYQHLKLYAKAIESFLTANDVQRHDSTFNQLSQVHSLQNNSEQSIEIFKEALEFSPENPNLLTNLGLLYLRTGNLFDAFSTLGNSLTLNPSDARTILAAGAIIQTHGDMDVALVKYRVAVHKTPNSAPLWSNIGLCFYTKNKLLESVSSLKRSLFLNPFDWVIAYNLGLVYLATNQNASAFLYLSSAINLNPMYSISFMYLGIALTRLNDFENAEMAFERALYLNSNKSCLDQKATQSNVITFNHISQSNQTETREKEADLYDCLINLNYCMSFMQRLLYLDESDDNDDDDIDDDDNDDENAIDIAKASIVKAKTHFLNFEKIWLDKIDDETKTNELSNVEQQRQFLRQFFGLQL